MKKIIAQNKKARFDYEILDTTEAGVELKGFEVKSVRAGKVSIKESYAKFVRDELWLIGANINKYEHLAEREYDPTRSRKLLLSRKELKKMFSQTKEKGLTIVPLDIHLLNNRWVKLTLGVAKGKKRFDKRETIKRREQDRELRRKFG
ncbi:MAG TPA: SsrA-binding protein SmpB [bacterium]|nr:SsrA-binding protein SmpB [bacterium]